MSDITTLQFQKENKPNIEDVLPHYYDGNELETALNFIAHLRTGKMNPRWAGVHNTWNCSFKGKVICSIRLGKTWHIAYSGNVKWEVSPNLINLNTYENQIINENMQNYIWNGLTYCKSCINTNGLQRECSPGTNKTILKKDCVGLCGGFVSGRMPISFINPDEAAINYIKKLLELEKQARTSL